jgi:hypothetical protein
LQRRLPGQLGVQKDFTRRGRPFCLYVVLGSRTHAPVLIDGVNAVLANLEVGERGDVVV